MSKSVKHYPIGSITVSGNKAGRERYWKNYCIRGLRRYNKNKIRLYWYNIDDIVLRDNKQEQIHIWWYPKDGKRCGTYYWDEAVEMSKRIREFRRSKNKLGRVEGDKDYIFSVIRK